jgi:hypothetical protein
MLGVVGEYVGRIFLLTNGKPQAFVRRIERSEHRDVTDNG